MMVVAATTTKSAISAPITPRRLISTSRAALIYQPTDLPSYQLPPSLDLYQHGPEIVHPDVLDRLLDGVLAPARDARHQRDVARGAGAGQAHGRGRQRPLERPSDLPVDRGPAQRLEVHFDDPHRFVVQH